MDVDDLRKDLKTWERSFKAQNKREPTKQDIKLVPDIAEKYRLYRAHSKASSQTSSNQSSQNDAKLFLRNNSRDSQTPSTDNRVSATSSNHRKYVVPKSRPTTSAAPLSTSNPFSPTKRRLPIQKTGVDGGPEPSSARSFETSPDKARNPFLASPSKPAFKRSSSNLFGQFNVQKTDNAVASSSSPTKSTRIPPSSHAQRPSPPPSQSYDFATSPRKLRALISSSSALARDTPRTKARKRMRGEEVPFTPSEKRRRLSVTNDEAEDLPETPAKDISSRGQAFRPIFKDDEGSSNVRGALFARPPQSALASFDAGPSDVADAPKKMRRDKWGDEVAQISTGSNQGLKRAHPSDPTERNDQTSTLFSNPLSLRPPSPPPRTASSSNSSKAKGKWPSRKKAKIDVDASANEDGSDEDGENDGTAVEYRKWRVWGPPLPAQNDEDQRVELEAEGDPHRVYATTTSAPDLDEAHVHEETEVDLPDEMRRLLAISSPDSQPPKEQNILKAILGGHSVAGSLDARGPDDIWGAGEWDGNEWEWESEPEGWAGDIDM